MASSPETVTLLEQCQISPPHGSVPSTLLPLTFFDIPWLLSSPTSQPLFFYDFPSNFIQNTLTNNLKHSLSLTLEQFFLLAGNLVVPPQPSSEPHLSYTDGDSVSLTVAESSGDFSSLSCYKPRNVQPFHELVPVLSEPVVEANTTGTKTHPLLAIQITIFPGFGFCMGFALRKVAADCRTFDNFLKTWASFCKCPPLLVSSCKNLPSYDRDLIQDPSGLEQIFLEQWRRFPRNRLHQEVPLLDSIIDGVRATFVVGPTEMERIKGRIVTQSLNVFGSDRFYLSPYVVICALVWVCWTKTHWSFRRDIDPMPQYFGFNAGGINRLVYFVPKTYFGNCIGFGRTMVKRDQLMGKNGILYAAKAIGEAIKELDNAVFGKAKNWITDWNDLFGSKCPSVVITGSPKVASYQLDFGWGRPKKIEEISIDETRAISLLESRDVGGGMEVGLSLNKAEMDLFGSLFEEGLKQI